MDDIKSIIAKNITNLRIENNLTQLELAKKLNYSDKAVSKWERGESIPEICTLAVISDIFGVSLDYLIRSKQSNEKTPINEELMKNKTINRSILTGISCALVWFTAVFIYILIDIIFRNVTMHWITFFYALPVSMIVWLIFNSIWFNKRLNYLIVSILMWSVFLAFQMTFIPLGVNIWQIYLLGVPGQILILLWSKLFVKKK